MQEPKEIILNAIREYNPVKIALLFSGGHDSLVSSHVSATVLNELGIPFIVYHGDTTIGIPETQQYVKDVCQLMGWELAIRKPPKKQDHYEEIVRKHGFPGPTKASHQYMFRRLKERALKAWVTHEAKSGPYKRENVLLLSGIRKSESRIRMGYTVHTKKEDSRVWSNPIFFWSKQACERYMKAHNLPRNPVKDAICISGECLCGAFAGREEYAEIKACFPHVAKRIDELTEIAKENGHPWPWSMGPNEWYKNHPPGQMDMFMCVGCEEKRLQGAHNTLQLKGDNKRHPKFRL